MRRTEITKRGTIRTKSNAEPGAIVTQGEIFNFISKFHCASKNDEMSRSFDSDMDESTRLRKIIHFKKKYTLC